GGGNVAIVPKETDTTFDSRGDMIGTGPIIMSKYTTSEGWVLKRNPAYYDPDYLLVDQVDLPIITEYAAALAQFKAGNLHYFDLIKGEDLLSVKREQPQLQIYPADFVFQANTLTFGLLPEGKSPFLDERVRQAVSMSWDSDLWIDTFQNVSRFRSEGLPV